MVLGMPTIRQIVRSASAVGAAGILAPVAGEWFVKLAEERGLYEEPSSHLERAMSWLASWTAVPGFAWVAGSVLGFAVGLWVDALLRRRDGNRVASAQIGSPASMEDGIYVGRILIDANRLNSDLLLEFAIIAFNATGLPLRLGNLRGKIGYAPSTNAPTKDHQWLPPAIIREDNVTEFASGSEFMVIVSQRVPGALAGEMDHDLAAGRRVMFILENLSIAVMAGPETTPVTLPVWNRVSLDRSGHLTVVMPIATASVSITV